MAVAVRLAAPPVAKTQAVVVLVVKVQVAVVLPDRRRAQLQPE